MASRRARRGGLGVTVVLVLTTPIAARAQDLGHKLLGTIGLEAGARPPPGLRVADRFVYYAAGRLNDRNGSAIPGLGFDLDIAADALGIAYTSEGPRSSTTVTVAAAVPIAHASVSTTNPEASLDKLGIADIYVQLAGLGWRAERVDIVASYALYLPTGRFDLGGRGVSSGQVTYELALGGQLAFDEARRWFVAGLASYDLYGEKWGADITRGDTLQVQGGVGVRPFEIVEMGMAAYAQWQVRDDRGADVPERLRGARDRAVGLGPELAVSIPPLRMRLRVRCAWDLAASARPDGRVFVVGLSFPVWQPEAPEAAARPSSSRGSRPEPGPSQGRGLTPPAPSATEAP